jgi:outer membrane receptor protein involved in Fe transport
MPTFWNCTRYCHGKSYNAFPSRATARYKPDKDTSFYASYARGRRPEVLAVLPPTLPYGAPVFTDVPAETVDSYEVGAKTLTLDGALRLESAIYYYDYNNFQTLTLQNATLVTANAGKASSYGFEGALDWALTGWARLFATYSYSHGRFESGAYKGNRFSLSPDHKLSLGASISDEMLGGLVTFVPAFTWQSKIFFDDDNDIPALQKNHILPDTKQDEFQGAYGLVDLRLSYQPEDAPWSVEAFVNNVADTRYIQGAGNTGDYFGIPTFVAGLPRFYGIAFTIGGSGR